MNDKNKFDLGKSLLFEYQNNKKFKDIWDSLELKKKSDTQKTKGE